MTAAAGEVSDAAARRVLLDNGREVGKRGRLSASQWEEYHAIMDGADHVTDIGDGDESMPVDETSRESMPVNESSSGDRPPSMDGPGVGAEQRPRTVGGGRKAGERVRGMWARRGGGGSARGKGGGKGKRARPRKQQREQPWRPTAGIIEHTWERMAQAAGAIPPLQRILAAQAPLAGVVFEGQLRDTIVDRLVLQHAARYEAAGEALAAMIGVPGLTALIFFKGRTEMGKGPDDKLYPLVDPQTGAPIWDAQTQVTLIAPLRYCLISWLAVSDRYAADVIAQAEATVRKGQEADQIIAWIFKVPDTTMTFNDVMADAQRAASDFAGARPHPGPGPGATAFRPSLTVSVLSSQVVE